MQTTEMVRQASDSIIACKGVTLDGRADLCECLSAREIAELEEECTCVAITIMLSTALFEAGEHWLDNDNEPPLH